MRGGGCCFFQRNYQVVTKGKAAESCFLAEKETGGGIHWGGGTEGIPVVRADSLTRTLTTHLCDAPQPTPLRHSHHIKMSLHSHVPSYPIAHLPSVPPGHDSARGHSRMSVLVLELRQYPGARFSDSSVPSAVRLSVLGKVPSQSRALSGFATVQPSHSRVH